MCGIIFAHAKDQDVRLPVLTQYIAQAHRGKEGYGFVRATEEAKNTVARALHETDILDELVRLPTSTILFHHRTPTSTKNTLPSTHPFIVRTGGRTFAIVHNGVIWNDDELAAFHKTLDIKYISQEADGTFNDSEALAHDFARVITGEQKKSRARGSAAILALEYVKNEPRYLWVYHNASSPLAFIAEHGLFLIASTITGGTPVVTDSLFCYDIVTGEKKSQRTIKIKTYTEPIHTNKPAVPWQPRTYPISKTEQVITSQVDTSKHIGFSVPPENAPHAEMDTDELIANFARDANEIAHLDYEHSTQETDDEIARLQAVEEIKRLCDIAYKDHDLAELVALEAELEALGCYDHLETARGSLTYNSHHIH